MSEHAVSNMSLADLRFELIRSTGFLQRARRRLQNRQLTGNTARTDPELRTLADMVEMVEKEIITLKVLIKQKERARWL